MKELAICLLLSVACLGQSARQYYNELYKAGGLDRMADEYVCFDDDSKLETFFIFGESKTIREFLIADGSFGKMSKEFQKKLKEDFLIVRGYDKGVAIELSRQRLGYAETVRQLELRLARCHPTNRPQVAQDLKQAQAHQGPTVFDWLTEIIHDHGPSGRYASDGVELLLD